MREHLSRRNKNETNASILCAFDAKKMLFFLNLETEKKTSILCAFDANRMLFGLNVGAPPRDVFEHRWGLN